MQAPSSEQQAVIDAWGQGLAVLAGAGSGKTTTLVAKCAALLSRNPQARFAAVSFTEKSAADLRDRLTQALGPLGAQGHFVGTLHGFCGMIVRENSSRAGFDGQESILSEREAILYWERALDWLWYGQPHPEVQQALERLLDRESQSGLHKLLLRLREVEAYGVVGQTEDGDLEALRSVGRAVLDRYDQLKRRAGVMDFGDLERGAARALGHAPVCEVYHQRFDLVLVDEFQDTNPQQGPFVRALARPDFSNLCVVGDPKQSIYRFRDADVSVFEEFCARLPLKLKLTLDF